MFEVVRDITGELLQVHAASVGRDPGGPVDAGSRGGPASRGCTSRSTGSATRTTRRQVETALQRRAPRRAGRRGGLAADAEPSCSTSSASSRRTRPPGCPTRSSTRASSCCAGSPTTTSRSSATASTTCEGAGDDLALRAEPATGLGILRGDQLQSTGFQKLPRSGAGARAGAEAAGAGEGQLARHRAPVGLSGLRRDQALRRGRQGRRGAPLPRALLGGDLHRVGAADPDAAGEGRRGAPRTDIDPTQPRRQVAGQRARELPARRAVPHADRGAGSDRGVGDAHP